MTTHGSGAIKRVTSIDLLLEAKGDPNEQDAHQETPLHHAAKRDDLAAVESLLKAKADPNIKAVLQMTPLHYATTRGASEVIERLLKAKADPSAKDFYGKTPLHYANSHGYIIRTEPPTDSETTTPNAQNECKTTRSSDDENPTQPSTTPGKVEENYDLAEALEELFAEDDNTNSTNQKNTSQASEEIVCNTYFGMSPDMGVSPVMENFTISEQKLAGEDNILHDTLN